MTSIPALPAVTYLSIDPVTAGVGASQVLPYVEGLCRRGLSVTLHSLEREPPSPSAAARVAGAGVGWCPHRWGRDGAAGGLLRVLRGASYVRRTALVHARSDLPAASAVLARPAAWVWDVRGFWADERIALGKLRPGSVQERLLRVVERRAAVESGAIITLTAAAVDVLARRHGSHVRDKARVIPTCVDTDRFRLSPMPPAGPVRLILSGSFNQLYDVASSLAFVAALRRLQPAKVTMLRPRPTEWDRAVIDAGGSVESVAFAEMPERLRAGHAGLSLRREHGGDVSAACAPTKLAEFLATGRPVVVTPGLGDMDRLVARHRCGVVVSDLSEGGLGEAAEKLCDLIADPSTPQRCRAAAEANFDLEDGVSRLVEVYRLAVAGGEAR